MTVFNPLSKILDDNKLTGPNYTDWLRNLEIVLTAEKISYVLTEKMPEASDAQPNNPELKKWRDDDSLAKCYILASISNVLQQQHKSMNSAADMLLNLKEMFGDQNRASRNSIMKQIMNTKMVEGSSVREHVIKMMGYLNELETLGADLDAATKNDMILASLPHSYNQFIMNYNMNKMDVTMSELLNMLRAAEDLINKNKPTVMVSETKTFKPKGKVWKKKGKGKSFPNNKGVAGPKGENQKKDKSVDACFHCGKKGHWKRNCRTYLASIKKDKPSEGDQKAK